MIGWDLVDFIDQELTASGKIMKGKMFTIRPEMCIKKVNGVNWSEIESTNISHFGPVTCIQNPK